MHQKRHVPDRLAARRSAQQRLQSLQWLRVSLRERARQQADPRSGVALNDEGSRARGRRFFEAVRCGMAESGAHADPRVRYRWFAVERERIDRVERAIKLDNLDDGFEIDRDTGDELFSWVWRHPNVESKRVVNRRPFSCRARA